MENQSTTSSNEKPAKRVGMRCDSCVNDNRMKANPLEMVNCWKRRIFWLPFWQWRWAADGINPISGLARQSVTAIETAKSKGEARAGRRGPVDTWRATEPQTGSSRCFFFPAQLPATLIAASHSCAPSFSFSLSLSLSLSRSFVRLLTRL